MSKNNIDEIIKIQSWFRCCILRFKIMPLIMYKIKYYLKLQNFKFENFNHDLNSISSSSSEMYFK